jgi:mannitol-1-phosphate/altronate dehydrogenase
LHALSEAAGPDASRLAASLLGVREIFDAELAQNPKFSGPVTSALELLLRLGAKETVRRTN